MNVRIWIVLAMLVLATIACEGNGNVNAYGQNCATETRHGCP